MPLSKERYVMGYVHLTENQVDTFRRLMKEHGICYYDDWGEVPEGKMMCACGYEVRDHENNVCPTEEGG